MFRLNEIYYTKSGCEARVICVDAAARPMGENGVVCNIIAVVTAGPSSGLIAGSKVVYSYDEQGRLSGNPDHSTKGVWNLVSNDPTEEEADLIRQIGDLCERHTDDRQEAMLKVIRQLRKK